MKKLFLTSGLVLCMAGQAYASTDITYNGNDYGASGCNYTYLDTYDTSSSLEAIWDAVISGAITLNSNRFAAIGDSNAASTASTAAALSPVYSKYNTGIYSSVANAEAETNAITSLSTQPAMTGYTFAGFYTGKAGSGTQVIDSSGNYLPAATTQISTGGTTATWYAHWTANHYDVIYDPGTHGICGASCETTGTNAGKYVDVGGAIYDSNYTAVAQNTTSIVPKTGYNFVGWNTQSGQTTANWTGATPWTSASPLTVYAAYSPKKYDVTYAVGTCGGADKTYNDALTYDANYTVLGTDATDMTVTVPEGYTFNGWQESLSGNAVRDAGYQYQPWQTDSNLTLTAQCSANSINITFDCAKPTAGADIPGGSGTYTVTASETVSANPATIQIAMDDTGKINQTCSLNGWTFDGWSCTAGLTSDSAGTAEVSFITKAQTETANGGYQVYMKDAAGASGVTCKAKWTQNHITLNWNKNGADSADIAATACDYDGGIDLPTAPTRQGYTFQGWTVCPTAHGTAGTVQNGVCTNTACESGYHVDSNGACVAD